MKKQIKLLLSLCFLFLLLPLTTKAYAAAITWTWDTTGQLEKTIIVQTTGETTINWGDETSETIATSATDLTLTHTYTAAGSYTVEISGNVVTKLDCCSDEIGEKITSIDVTGATVLKYLDCGYGQLTSLNLSANTALTHLACNDNELTNIDVSNNTNLTYLDVSRNSLATIDVSENSDLTYLDVSANSLSEIDIRSNTALANLYCGYNQITTLDIRANANLNVACCAQSTLTNLYISAAQNRELTVIEENKICVEESENVIHKNSVTVVNADAMNFTWDTTGDLTKAIKVQTTGETTINWGDGTIETVAASAIDLTLTHTYSTEGGYVVGFSDNVVTKLDCCSDENGEKITDIDVTEATVLTYLDCGYSQLTSLDVSANTALTHLACNDNELTSIDVSNNTALTYLDVSRNSLTTINVSVNTALTYLDVAANSLTAIDISSNTALEYFYCGYNQITELDIRPNTNLSVVCCAQSSLTNLYITAAQNKNLTVVEESKICTEDRANVIHKNSATSIIADVGGVILFTWDTTDDLTKKIIVRTTGATTINWGDGTVENISSSSTDLTLTHTYSTAGSYTVGIEDDVVTKFDCCSDKNGEKIIEIDVSEATALTYLDCGYGQLTSLDVSANTALTHLACNDNVLTSINLSNNTALTYLDVSRNSLSAIDVSANTALTHLDVAANNLEIINVNSNTSLVKFYCGYNNLTTLNVRQNSALSVLCCAQESLTTLYVTAAQNNNLTVVEESEACIEERANVIHKYPITDVVPDVIEGAIVMTWDTTGDLTKTLTIQATTATTINWGDGAKANISTFGEDVTLTHTYSAEKEYTVTVADNVLTKFDACSDKVGEQIISIDVSEATALTYLDCGYSKLTSLDVSANTALTHLACNDNELTSINISNNTALTYLDISRNGLTTISVSGNTALTYLDVAANNLTSIDISSNTALVNFYCGYNQITTLDIRPNTNLSVVCCAQSSLTNLYITAVQNKNLTIVEEDEVCVEERQNVIHKYSATTIIADASGVILFTWDATEDLTKTIVVQTTGKTTINWGDGTVETIVSSSTDLTLTHTYGAAGSYTVGIEDNVITKLDCCTDKNGEKITEIDVSEATVLTYLDCGYSKLTSLDVSANTALTHLACNDNELTSINISNNTALTYLDISRNGLTTISVSGNTALTYLDVAANNLTSIDISSNTALVNFYCGYNQMTTLDIRPNTNLSVVCCAQSSLTNLYITAVQNKNLTIIEEDEVCVEERENVIHKYSTTVINVDVINLVWDTTGDLTKTIVVRTTGTTKINWGDGTVETIVASSTDLTLTHTYSVAGSYTVGIEDNVVTKLDCCNDENGEKITEIGISNATMLTYLDCGYSKLTSLDVSANTALTYLACNDNALTSIDVSNNTALTYLDVSRNNIATINVSGNTALTYLDVAANNLTAIDISSNAALVYFYCGYNQITTLNIRPNTNLSVVCCAQSSLVNIYISAAQSKNMTIVEESDVCVEERENVIHKYPVTVVNVDAIGLTWDTTGDLSKTIIVRTTGETTINWGDGTVETVTASATDLTLTHVYSTAGSYIVGIGDNVVTKLYVVGEKVSDINTIKATALKSLELKTNLITELDLSANIALENLNCEDNQLTELDLSTNTALIYLYCEGNQLTSLNVSANKALTHLYCGDNEITELNLSNNSALIEVYCGDNKLTTLDITKNSLLNKLCCVQSTLTTLTLDEIQMEEMTILNKTTACVAIDTDETIHKYPNTVFNVIGVAIKIQPSAVAINGMKFTIAYAKAKSMLNDPIYGISSTGSSILQSHMMKNTEWGAVAYLTNAIGRNPWRNNSNAFTGFSASTVDGQTEESGFAWNTANGVKASTTHNVFGVYDMNGGREEFVAAYVADRGASEIVTDATQTKDVDKYTEISDSMNYKGGALSETGNFTDGKSWNDSLMVNSATNPYLVRGGWWYSASNPLKADMFMSYGADGSKDTVKGFRPVIIVKK